MSNAADRAYQAIRARILDGSFAPGAKLGEENLAAEIGVSRTPVRDALRRLLADGLVTAERNHGTFVTDMAPEEVMEVFELRALLESHSVRKAAARITPAELAELDSLADAMEALAGDEEDRRTAFARLNTQFHTILVRASGSRRMEAMLVQMFQVPLVHFKQHRMRNLVNIERSNRQHREIIEALREGRGDWAALVLQAHLLSTRPG